MHEKENIDPVIVVNFQDREIKFKRLLAVGTIENGEICTIFHGNPADIAALACVLQTATHKVIDQELLSDAKVTRLEVDDVTEA